MKEFKSMEFTEKKYQMANGPLYGCCMRSQTETNMWTIVSESRYNVLYTGGHPKP